MCKMLNQYADKIKGTFSFFDRMIINGYILPLTSEHSRSGALFQLGILYKDFKTYFMNVTESIKSHIEGSASELGRPVIYLSSAKSRKEDAARESLAKSPVDKSRPVGCRVKFKMKSNSIKMYDKCSVLRIETTINDPREFKVYATVRHQNGTESKEWKPMGKSISNLYRYAGISKTCNQRFLDAMVNIVPVKSTLEETGKICCSKKMGKKTVTGFNVWSPEVVLIMETVCDGRFLVSGFCNKDISGTILPGIRDAKKRSPKTSRILKKLRQHGLIKKVQRSRRYHVTSKGRRIMGSLIELRKKDYPQLAAKAA